MATVFHSRGATFWHVKKKLLEQDRPKGLNVNLLLLGLCGYLNSANLDHPKKIDPSAPRLTPFSIFKGLWEQSWKGTERKCASSCEEWKRMIL